MDLFGKTGIMTEIFTSNDVKWRSHKKSEKAKHAFMINRYFSIAYPTQAQAMNTNGFNPYVTVETWRFIGKQLKRAPKWFWTKAKKAEKAPKAKGKKYVPSEEIIHFYITRNEISTEQFNSAMKLNPEVLLTYLQRIEKSMETSE